MRISTKKRNLIVGLAISASALAFTASPAAAGPNSGSVKCYTGVVIPWGLGPNYLYHSAAEALTQCPDVKPRPKVIHENAVKVDEIRVQEAIAAGDGLNPVDNTGDASGFGTEKVGQSVGKPPRPTDPLPPYGQGNNIPVLNCSNSPNNPPSVNVSTGQPGWTVKLPNGSPITIVPANNVSWSAVPGAQWVGPAGAPQAPGQYIFETKVRVLKCPKGNPAKITAQFRADNIGTLALLDPALNAVTTMNQTGTANYGFLPASLSPAGGPGVHSWMAQTNGVYTIRMTVQNSGGPTGVAANISLTR